MDIIYYSTVITKSLETKEASPTVVQIMAAQGRITQAKHIKPSESRR